METEKSPLSFFENLLEYDKYDLLKKKFIADYIKNVGQPYKIDFENGIIEEWEERYYFSTTFINTINREYRLAESSIDKYILTIISKNISPDEFIKFQIRVLDSLIIKTEEFYSKYSIVRQVLLDLKNHLTGKFNTLNLSHSTANTSTPSFKWDYIENCEQNAIITIENLYSQLLDKKIIEGSKEDFVNGFMGKDVQNGIRWLLKNYDQTHSSKPTLFAFINYLIEENYLTNIQGREYNDAIKYVFREYNGNILNYIRQSKSSSTATIAKDIQEIINNL